MGILFAILWFICGFICMKIAYKKGYNEILAFFLGIFGAFISVIVYACLDSKKND